MDAPGFFDPVAAKELLDVARRHFPDYPEAAMRHLVAAGAVDIEDRDHAHEIVDAVYDEIDEGTARDSNPNDMSKFCEDNYD